ncbi:MAG: rhodanese-like domain-containing protein [Lachnospiraceae bacterium]|nr:rhodanese-like domain-containing protein [Lachnospiraceae bacterium]
MGLFDFLKKLGAGADGADDAEGSGRVRPKKAEINAAVAGMKDRPGATLIDVRDPMEYAGGHIPGSINVPVGSIAMMADAMPDDEKVKPVYVYCLTGMRSRRAAQILCGAGFTDVTNLGGINGWRGELET